jgi:hypothetical protein
MPARALLAALCFVALVVPCASGQTAKPAAVTLEAPLSPPGWALLERELLRANTAACKEFFHQYFDDRGYLLCVERWGGDDGPDDAIENCSDWPLLVAVGAPDTALLLYKKAWEGHLRQYTLAKTTHVPFAKDGMYYKEFPVMFDWLHHAEGLTPFNQQGLCDPGDPKLRQRLQRFAGFYMNEDPGAPNYDPKYKIIRSLFNGSRGPLLRKATALDWTGDPFDVKGFKLLHGERSYEEMLAHFKDYNDIVGDHPLNLLSTTLALNAYMLTRQAKYKAWALEYIDAWRQRVLDNDGIIPTNIGLDGKIGGATGGKWYGGVYGWAFTVVVPQNGKLAHRNNHHLGFVGFANAYLLTGDDRFLDAWRQQMDKVNAHKKAGAGGKTVYPHMHGDQGWYDFTPQKYAPFALELYCLSLKAEDRARVPASGWLDYLEGKNPKYPEATLRQDLARVRDKVLAMRKDPSTPDTRLADNPLEFTPASVASLIELMLGGPHPGKRGSLLHCQVRYFDPEARRAGLPEDVAALVEEVTPDGIALTLVNVHQLEPRTVLIQGGAYGEHQFTGVATGAGGSGSVAVDAGCVEVRLAPGAGGRVVLKMKRHVNQPTLTLPWGR